ncbi:phage portal protein [Corynebacterium sp. TAE3-ERU12]|uniref:phage portal protein n=1 Tax=Corynebacterium sp. TAE3-ERU12 TaxID=2849491 RepID=UPI001C439946|nr:phage portal protein [Corynebacterium sp. TAE3-ERU12]MBV7294920.1 phage portal protein [Corynebacterium sp. TAE3-ERU12]
MNGALTLPSTIGLEATEEATLRRLVSQFASHQRANNRRTEYYLGAHYLHRLGQLGMAMPPNVGKLESVLGWPAKAVTTLEHRLNIMGFVRPNSADRDAGLADIWEDNDLSVTASMTHTASLIHGTAFVTVSAGDTAEGEPPVVIAARSAREATALWSRRRRCITAGLTVNNSDDEKALTMWLPDRTVTLTNTDNQWNLIRSPHRLGRVPMEMMSFRPHLEREFGVPRITNTVMDLTDSAARTLLRMEATAEFFSFPQRYALGVVGDDFDDSFKTYLNRFLALGRDENGDLPQMGEFSSSSPQPHIEQLRATASLFSGETSIPLNYLGIVHDNPSSADAIRAAEADLITVAERAQTGYGHAWARVMALAQSVRDGSADPDMRHLQVQWRDPATPTKAANAQSVMALVAAGVLPKMSEVTWELLGYDQATISRLRVAAAQQRSVERISTMRSSISRVTEPAAVDGPGGAESDGADDVEHLSMEGVL